MLTYNLNILFLLTIFAIILNKCNPLSSSRRTENTFTNSSNTHVKTILPKNITKHTTISHPNIKERKIVTAVEKEIEGKQNKSDGNFEVNYVEEYGGHDEDEFSRSYHNKGSKGYQDDEMFDKEDGGDYLIKNGDDISQVKLDQSLANEDIGKKYKVHSQSIIPNLHQNNNNKNDKQANVQKFYKPIGISLLRNNQNNIQNASLNRNENLKFQNEREGSNLNRGNMKNINKNYNPNIPETVNPTKRNCPITPQHYPKYVGNKVKEPVIDTTNAETNIRTYKQNSNVKPYQADVSGGYEAFIIHKRPSDNNDNNKKSYNKRNYKNGEENPDSIINYYPINRKESKIKYKGKKRIKKLNKTIQKKSNDDESKAENSQTENEHNDNDVKSDSDKEDYSDYNDDYIEPNNKETLKKFKKAIEKNADNIVNKKRKSKNKYKMQVTPEKKESESYDNENNEKQDDKMENIKNQTENDYDYNNENTKKPNKKHMMMNKNNQRNIKHHKHIKQNDNKPRNLKKSRKTVLAQEISDDTSKQKLRRKENPEKKYKIINNTNDENQSVNENEYLKNKKKHKILHSKSRNNFKLRKKINPKPVFIKRKKVIREKVPEELNNDYDDIQNQQNPKIFKKVFKNRERLRQKSVKENPTIVYENIENDSEENSKNIKHNNNYDDYYDDEPHNQESYNTNKKGKKNNVVQLKSKNNEDYYDDNESDYEDNSENVPSKNSKDYNYDDDVKQNSKDYNYDDDNNQPSKNNDLEDYYEALTEELDSQKLKKNQNKKKINKIRYQSKDDYNDDQEDNDKPNSKSCDNCDDYPSSENTDNENDNDDDVDYNYYED